MRLPTPLEYGLAALILIVGTYVSTPAPAADLGPELSVNVLVGSKHFTEDDLNESNPGIGIEMDLPNGARYGVMVFENSYEDRATAVYVGTDFYESRYVDLGINVTYAHGYGENLATPIAPLLTAEFDPAPDNALVPKVFFTGIPGYVVGFGLQWGL